MSLGDHGAGQWIAVFYAGHSGGAPLEAAGTAQAATPWVAVQRVAASTVVPFRARVEIAPDVDPTSRDGLGGWRLSG